MLDVLEPVEPPEGRIDAPTVCAQCDVRVSSESVGSRGQNVVRQRDVELEADREPVLGGITPPRDRRAAMIAGSIDAGSISALSWPYPPRS